MQRQLAALGGALQAGLPGKATLRLGARGAPGSAAAGPTGSCHPGAASPGVTMLQQPRALTLCPPSLSAGCRALSHTDRQARVNAGLSGEL